MSRTTTTCSALFRNLARRHHLPNGPTLIVFGLSTFFGPLDFSQVMVLLVSVFVRFGKKILKNVHDRVAHSLTYLCFQLQQFIAPSNDVYLVSWTNRNAWLNAHTDAGVYVASSSFTFSCVSRV